MALYWRTSSAADPSLQTPAALLTFASAPASMNSFTKLKRAGAESVVLRPSMAQVAEKTGLDPRKALKDGLQRSSTEYFKESGCAGCHHQLLTAMVVRAAHTAGGRVDEEVAREQLISAIAELERQQELFLQGIDLFGPQVLVPYLFELAGSGYAPDVITDSAVADLITSRSAEGSWNRGLAISRAPIQEGILSPNRPDYADSTRLRPTCAADRNRKPDRRGENMAVASKGPCKGASDRASKPQADTPDIGAQPDPTLAVFPLFSGRAARWRRSGWRCGGCSRQVAFRRNGRSNSWFSSQLVEPALSRQPGKPGVQHGDGSGRGFLGRHAHRDGCGRRRQTGAAGALVAPVGFAATRSQKA